MLLNHFSIEDFKDTFPLASLGARVCYSDKDIYHLLAHDKNIIDKQKRAEFLAKLGNDKHFSVFSHSFVYKRLDVITALQIGATYFKSRYNPKYPDVIGISLRHYLEELQKMDPMQYDNAFNQLAEYDADIDILYKTIDVFPTWDSEDGRAVKVYLLHLNTNYDGYAVFYIDGISRITTHQLIRHSTLNFSQRSQRYVKEDDNDTVFPDSILSNKELKEKAKLYDNLLKVFYKDLVYKDKIKREDARYFLPAGAKTSIVVSGTLNWINDFIEKRDIQHAQQEIRDVAYAMKYILDKKINK
jgi:thymidylate synthase (FAD)